MADVRGRAAGSGPSRATRGTGSTWSSSSAALPRSGRQGLNHIPTHPFSPPSQPASHFTNHPFHQPSHPPKFYPPIMPACPLPPRPPLNRPAAVVTSSSYASPAPSASSAYSVITPRPPARARSLVVADWMMAPALAPAVGPLMAWMSCRQMVARIRGRPDWSLRLEPSIRLRQRRHARFARGCRRTLCLETSV